MARSSGNRFAMVMSKANNKYAPPSSNSLCDLMNAIDWTAPPSANQAPKTNSNCQQNGLKYQVPPGYDGKFQSNWRAAKYSTAEPSITQLGCRTSAHST